MNNITNLQKQLEIFRKQEIPKFDNPTDAAEFVTEHMIEEYHLSHQSINWGYCFIWAYLFSTVYPGVSFVTSRRHVVAKVGELYYDSEHTYGEPNIEEFNWLYNPKSVNLYQMCWYWTRTGIQREKFRKIIQMTCPDWFYNAIYDNANIHWNTDGWGIDSDEVLRNIPSRRVTIEKMKQEFASPCAT